MVKRKLKLDVNVRPITIKFLLWAVIVFAVLGLLEFFGIFSFPDQFSPLIRPSIFATIVLLDLGLLQLAKSRGRSFKQLSGIERVGMFVAGLSLLSVALGLFGLSIEILSNFQAFIDAIVLIYLPYVIFKK